MEFEFGPSDVILGVTQSSQGAAGKLIIMLVILAAGLMARPIFVAVMSNLRLSNPLRNSSGGALIGVGLVLVLGVVFFAGRQRNLLVDFQRLIVDPIYVSVLHEDTCNTEGGVYCIIIFDDGYELDVNWHDRNVYMWKILNPDQGTVWTSLRPMARKDVNPHSLSLAPPT